MATEPKSAGSSGEEDSWEKLAENLFGIDFGQLGSSASATAPEQPPTVVNKIADAEDAAEDRSHLEKPVTSEETVPAETVAVASEKEQSESLEKAPPEEQPEQDGVDLGGGTGSDSFWDVLKDWAWDDEVSESKQTIHEGRSSGGQRRPSHEAPSTSREYIAVDASTSAADFRAEYVEDPDFGVGLLDDVDGESPAPPKSGPQSSLGDVDKSGAETAVEEVEPLASAQDEEQVVQKKRRRRRKRRRPRSTEGDKFGRGVIDEESSEPPAEIEQTEAEEKPSVERDEELVETPGRDSEQPKKESRRRPSRRRRRALKPEAVDERPSEPRDEQSSAGDVVPESDLSEDDGTDEDETVNDGRPSYPDLPTWEEAISEMLSPNVPEIHEAESGKYLTPKGDTTRSPGRRSRRHRKGTAKD